MYLQAESGEASPSRRRRSSTAGPGNRARRAGRVPTTTATSGGGGVRSTWRWTPWGTCWRSWSRRPVSGIGRRSRRWPRRCRRPPARRWRWPWWTRATPASCLSWRKTRCWPQDMGRSAHPAPCPGTPLRSWREDRAGWTDPPALIGHSVAAWRADAAGYRSRWEPGAGCDVRASRRAHAPSPSCR